MNLPQHLDEATILEEAQNLDLEKSLEIIRQQGTVQVGALTVILTSLDHDLTMTIILRFLLTYP